MGNISNKTYVHLWSPDMFGFKGGIQVFSNYLLNALQLLHPEFNYDVIVKNSKTSKESLSNSQNAHFYFAGNWPASLRTPAYTAQLLRLGIQHPPQLIITTHLHFMVAANWLKNMAGIPYWVIAHGIEAWDIKRPSLQKGLHNADRIFAVSSYTRERLIQEQGLSPDKVSILPNTIGAENFNIGNKPEYLLKRYGISSKQPVILTVSRLVASEQYKGYDKILRVLHTIRESVPGVHYLIAGKGDDRAKIEQLIRELDVQDCVTLAGYIPDSELCDHYNLCDVFAMPSKREGFGIVYLEALACGKPTLGGNKDGTTDALCNGELGVLVDPDDTEAIAQALTQILQRTYSHPILYQPEILRQKVIETYGFDKFKQTLGGYLEEFFHS
jgi:glycosyltransferase involved in cell wall biosynthesis